MQTAMHRYHKITDLGNDNVSLPYEEWNVCEVFKGNHDHDVMSEQIFPLESGDFI